jgi:hypothetical protein
MVTRQTLFYFQNFLISNEGGAARVLPGFPPAAGVEGLTL